LIIPPSSPAKWKGTTGVRMVKRRGREDEIRKETEEEEQEEQEEQEQQQQQQQTRRTHLSPSNFRCDSKSWNELQCRVLVELFRN
jgi:UPF0716 family protein affecting phage T7 exclusion